MAPMQARGTDMQVCVFACVADTRSSDLALLLGNMVQYQHAKQAADIIYSFYCDESEEGRLYHVRA